MEMEKYFNCLQPKIGDKVLVVGKKALPIALYLAGRAKQKEFIIKTHALIPPGEEVDNTVKELEIVREKYPEMLETIQEGLPNTSFENSNLITTTNASTFNKCVINQDNLTPAELRKLNAILKEDKTVLFYMGLEFFRPIKMKEKKLFGKKEAVISFKRVLEKVGFTVQHYEIEEKRLLCLATFQQLNEKQLQDDFMALDQITITKKILNEIKKYIDITKKGSKFALESEDLEYLYIIINVQPSGDKKSYYKFIFLDGVIDQSEKPEAMPQIFTIIVVPNTNTFKQELSEDETLIIPKNRVYDLFGEKPSEGG